MRKIKPDNKDHGLLVFRELAKARESIDTIKDP